MLSITPLWAVHYEKPRQNRADQARLIDHKRAVDLFYYGARYYDPALGRFITPDSVMTGLDSQALNPYSYCENNPATLVDPSGHYPTDPDSSHPYWKNKTNERTVMDFSDRPTHVWGLKNPGEGLTGKAFCDIGGNVPGFSIPLSIGSFKYAWDEGDGSGMFLAALGILPGGKLPAKAIRKTLKSAGAGAKSLGLAVEAKLNVKGIQVMLDKEGNNIYLWSSSEKPTNAQMAKWSRDLNAEVALTRFMGDAMQVGNETIGKGAYLMSTSLQYDRVAVLSRSDLYMLSHTHLDLMIPSPADIASTVNSVNRQKYSFIIPVNHGGAIRIKYGSQGTVGMYLDH
ncbi:MAG: RHS repeat-associated core domain-containing protein [Desulfobacteraceae bacterium]|nr:MAG: RHS repeat-associated core domain-containing protein [Desulfobacteraceae bacterium]